MAIGPIGRKRRAHDEVAGKLRHARSVPSALDGWVSIRGLRCRARQGVTDEQRARESDYVVDVWVRTDLHDAVEQDDLGAAIDITAIATTVRVEMARRPRALVERMAGDVARAMLARFEAADEVRVRVEKQEPEGLDADAESVELRLSRD
jgi:7,8-dihydroneopterin aldolase/epimerase/oxygenase